MKTKVTELFQLEDEALEMQMSTLKEDKDFLIAQHLETIQDQFNLIERLLNTIDRQTKMIDDQATQYKQVANHLSKLYQTNTIVN